MARQKTAKPAKPFDVTTKELVEINPQDWVTFLGLPGTNCELISADLSTVTTEADRLIRVNKPVPYAIHQEFQASGEAGFPARLLRYNVLSEEKTAIPVRTVAILLRPDADRYHNLTGTLERRDTQGHIYLTFHYQVVRLWRLPVTAVLQGGLATVPLAPLTDLSGTTPTAVVQQMKNRLSKAPPQRERLLWTSAYILAGLIYTADDIEQLFGGTLQMRESSTYQKILAEGRVEGEEQGRLREAQNMLLLFGKGRLGEANAEVTRTIRAFTSVERLEALAERLFAIESWDELLL